MQSLLVGALFAAVAVNAAPLASTLANLSTAGFLDPSISYSSGGAAVCVSGIIPVHASTGNNLNLNLPDNITNTQAVDLVLGLNTANSTLAATVAVSQQQVGGEFNISAQLCYPASSQNTSVVEFLTHGVAFSKTYWDFASPNNSYIETAASAGHATFSYDRLGIGKSSHPDPIQVVQGPLQIAIAQTLVQLLRNGTLADRRFSRIIGVGHSYGSALTTSVASQNPSAFDALVLTGFSDNTTGGIQFTASLNLEVAALSQTQRFPGEADGYLLPSTQYGIQYSFFRSPNFDQEVLAQAYATVQTTTVGEQFTMGTVGAPARNFTGPVLIVDGGNDLFFCDGDCQYPTNIPSASLKALFPRAANTSTSYILPGAGHGVNLAANAPQAFDRIQSFIGSLGF
jgi:pimeloyl-ACP methyl ester carboxylesterase